MSNIQTETQTRRVVAGFNGRGEFMELADITDFDADAVEKSLHNWTTYHYSYTDIHVSVKTITTTYMRVIP